MKFHSTFNHEGKLFAVYNFDNSDIVEVIAQVKSIKNAKDNKWDGKFYGFFSSGILAREGMCKNGKTCEYLEVYNEDGDIYSRTYFDENDKVCEYREYHISGKLKLIGHYKDDCKIGLWRYFYEDGTLSETAIWDTELHGEYVHYYKNGNIYEKGMYEKNKPIGEWTQYFADGKVKFRIKNSIDLDGKIQTEILESNNNIEQIKQKIMEKK